MVGLVQVHTEDLIDPETKFEAVRQIAGFVGSDGFTNDELWFARGGRLQRERVVAVVVVVGCGGIVDVVVDVVVAVVGCGGIVDVVVDVVVVVGGGGGGGGGIVSVVVVCCCCCWCCCWCCLL